MGVHSHILTAGMTKSKLRWMWLNCSFKQIIVICRVVPRYRSYSPKQYVTSLKLYFTKNGTPCSFFYNITAADSWLLFRAVRPARGSLVQFQRRPRMEGRRKHKRKLTSQQECKVEVASLQRENFFSRIAPSTEKVKYNITVFCYKSRLCCKLKM